MLPPPPSRNPNATGAVASVAPPSNIPKDYYDLAYGYVLRKDYAFAEDAFQTFLKKYPNDKLVPDAQFWLGESLFQRQRYDAAAEQFLAVSTKHSAHAKAPDALLRLGQCLRRLIKKRWPAPPCGGGPQISARLEHREAGRRAGTEACPLLRTRRISAAEARRFFSTISPTFRFF